MIEKCFVKIVSNKVICDNQVDSKKVEKDRNDESIKNNVCNAFAFSIFETIHVGLFSNLVLQIKNNKKIPAFFIVFDHVNASTSMRSRVKMHNKYCELKFEVLCQYNSIDSKQILQQIL